MQDLIWERWEEVDRIFGEALDLAVEERPTFLQEACGTDLALLETVSGLLESSIRAEKVITGPGTRLLRAAFKGPEDSSEEKGSPEGSVVGRYRIVQEIGRGGMATVYEAARADGEFDQRVAIKILRGVDSEDVSRRFLAERQILSGLSHPNIGRLLDGGTTETGLPYLVMELVEGEPITRWADRQRLTLPDRLRLFQQVVEAVHFAHTHLVVHRDIKPSNVLVDSGGRVRLLDFGIAKLLEDTGGSSPLTQPTTRWMTPEYAAPEQILGEGVTTVTDVYGLGVLLYELLSGRRPFVGGKLSGFQLERAICEDVPPPLSAAAVKVYGSDPQSPKPEDLEAVARARSTTPPALTRALSGDLEAVVSKALRKKPEERYPSAQELSEDLERHMAGMPVTAREGLWPYRAQKFLRRHWLGVGAAASIMVVLAGSSVLLARQQAETARERDRASAAALEASAEAENARLVVDFLADVFRGRDPSQAPSDTLTARELLEWGTERVNSEFSERPAVQADLLIALGNAHHNLGLLDEGIGLLERAVSLRRATFGERSPEVAEALMNLGQIHRNNRDFSFALPFDREALSILREVPESDEGRIADVLESLGMSFRNVQRLDSAEVLLRQALEIREGDPAQDGRHTGTTLNLAYVLRGAGKLDEAEVLYEEGIPQYRTLGKRDDGALAVHLNNLAYLKRVRGDYSAAEDLYREAFEIFAELHGRGHPTSLMFSANLASSILLQGRSQETVDLLRQRTRDAEAQWPEGHWRVGQTYNALGDALLRAGDIEGAEEPLQAAVAQFSRALGEQHNWTSFAWARIAVIRLLTDDPEGGRLFLDRLHSWSFKEKQERGGRLTPDTAGRLEPFLKVLEAVGLEEEHQRFSELLEEGPP